jgi:hypothetical protein
MLGAMLQLRCCAHVFRGQGIPLRLDRVSGEIRSAVPFNEVNAVVDSLEFTLVLERQKGF